MKEALRKLKGNSFNCEIGQIQLVQIFREEQSEFDQLYFYTHQDNLLCKVYGLQAESSQQRFRHQQQVFQEGKYPQLAEYLFIEEIQIKKKKYGVLLLKITKNTFLQQTYASLTYSDWLNLTDTVLDFADKLKEQKQVFLNLNPWSIARNSEGEWRILDAQFLTNEGSYEQLSESNYILMDICEKEYRYRSPELLDPYSKNKIDYCSDIFSYAIVLHQLLYRQYPFDSKLSQSHSSYHPINEESFLLQFIRLVLKPYAKRPGLDKLRSVVQGQRKKMPKEVTSKNMSSGSTNQSKGSSIFSGLTQMISKLTTQTEGWYLSFTENDEKVPEEKYLNLLINKLYKKETKLQKLLSIILKYIKAEDTQRRQNQIVKTLLLIIILFRRGPNTMNYQWQEILGAIEALYSKNAIILQLCAFCRQKIAINNKFKGVYRGNFFVEDLSKFKNATIQTLRTIYSHLLWLIESVNSTLVYPKKESPLIEYIKQVYCDEILDAISMLIFSVISVRKDNELQLRKDDLSQLVPLQKQQLNNVLKKISHLSNHVNAHPIYSLQAEYLYYKEEIQLRQTPYYTSLQHFYKHCRQYKGLIIPQNYSLNYCSGDQKEFLSNENNRIQRDKSQSVRQKEYFQEEIDSDGQKGNSFKIIEDSPSPQKLKDIKKSQFLQQLNQERPKKESNNNIQIIKAKKQQTKKTVTFDQFFNLDLQKKPSNKPNNSVTLIDFQQHIPPKPTQKNQAKPQTKKGGDFSFFEAFKQPTQPPKKEEVKGKPAFDNFFDLFGNNPKEKPKEKVKEKAPTLVNSNSQKLIQQNILNYDWLKKSTLPQPKISVSNELLKNILSGLKLKQLKDSITNNQQIIIDFSKLTLEKVIGSGSAGEVYLGKYNNQTVAIKKVKTKQNPNALKEFQRELLTYIKIKRNAYLVSLVGLSKSQQNYYLLTQFCNSGSLFDLLHKRANITPLSWKQKISLALQIAKGMLALHQMNPAIIHRDLKSLNVFVIENSGQFTAKVADFGLSRSPQSEMMTTYLGTLHWMAPQLLDNQQYSIKVDVYSYAVVLWQICSRRTPYNQLSNPMAIMRYVMQMKRPNLQAIPNECPPQLIDLMKRCWAHDSQERPLFNEVIDILGKISPLC